MFVVLPSIKLIHELVSPFTCFGLLNKLNKLQIIWKLYASFGPKFEKNSIEYERSCECDIETVRKCAQIFYVTRCLVCQIDSINKEWSSYAGLFIDNKLQVWKRETNHRFLKLEILPKTKFNKREKFLKKQKNCLKINKPKRFLTPML